MPDVHLQRVTASGQTHLDFTVGFSSNYDAYKLRFHNLRRDSWATPGSPPNYPGQEGIFIDTGSGFDASDKYTTSAIALVNASANGGTGPNPNAPQGIYQIMGAGTGLIPAVDTHNDSTKGLCGEMEILNDGVSPITYQARTWRPDPAGNILKSDYSGYYDGTGRITALRLAFVPAGAQFISGMVDLIGISH